jgi:hypothetical protein
MITQRKTALTIFLCSLASLAYEVVLTRIFSISLWYHYAFMVISIAMLGFAASGTVVSIFPGLKRGNLIRAYALLLGIAIPFSHLLANQASFDPVQLAWDRTELLSIGLLYAVLAIPFFCCGLVVVTAFSVQSGREGVLYGADLIGAASGSMGILLLLYFLPPERAPFLISLPPLLAACLGGFRLRSIAVAFAMLNLALFIRQPAFAGLSISPYKGLASALRFPGARHLKSYTSPSSRVDTFQSPAVRFAPGLSLRWLHPLPRQTGLAVDGGDISAITAINDGAGLAFLEQLPSALPYEMERRRRVLVLDPRGGLQLLLASHYGVETTVVEGNSLLVRVITGEWRAFAGDIYSGRTHCGLGRSWLEGRGERFDLIDLSLMGTEAYGSFGIAEDYRFTVEAFREYLRHLRFDGLISVNLYLIPPARVELRLITTIAAAMEELGIREPGRHLALVRSWGTLCLLAKRSPLTQADIAGIRGFARERWFDTVYYPGIAAGETNRYVRMRSDDYSRSVAALMPLEQRRSFIQRYPFDIAPVRDDAPFFHYFLKLGRMAEIYRMMGGKWQFFLEEGGMVPALFCQVLLLSAPLLGLPLLSGMALHGRTESGRRLLPYFALLGCGFMFVETALIQKVILPLETPSLAMATILASLLASSGGGSLLSQRHDRLRSPWTCALIALLVVLQSLLLPVVSTRLAPWPLSARVCALFLAVIPLGFLMGIPFPAGLRHLGECAPTLVPWAWVINGCFSVMAPILAIMVATVAGFSTVLLLGALAYALAWVNLGLFLRPTCASTTLRSWERNAPSPSAPHRADLPSW